MLLLIELIFYLKYLLDKRELVAETASVTKVLQQQLSLRKGESGGFGLNNLIN